MKNLAAAFRRSQALTTAAKEEYQRAGHPEMDLEHLLLALVIVGGPSARILTAQGVTLYTARDAAAQVHANQIASLGIAPVSPAPHETIPDPAMTEVRMSERVLDVLRKDDFQRDDRVLLEALLEEPSGLILSVLDELDVTESTVREAIHSYQPSPSETTPVAANSALQDVVYIGHVPAAPEDVWNLISDPARRLEWDTLFTGRVEWDGAVLTTFAPLESPDGKKNKVKPGFDPTEHVISAFVRGEVIEWEQSWPNARGRGFLRRLRMHVRADGTGTQLTLTKSRPVPRGLRRRLLNPLYRFFTWQELSSHAGAISRALR